MKTVIQIKNLSKQYKLGNIGTGTLSHDLRRWRYKLLGQEDPYSIVGEKEENITKGNKDYIWALQDINLEVEQGEIIGIIGKNGAGKSTLLKILSKITSPTKGSVKVRGRIGALLEVGTGFHPELTGLENIYLNGVILGMKKTEVRAKLDEIVEFSGCGRFIDTPVKRYSSGMTVRLGFAVAAHLDPEILVVDEVLAVGDAEFQKKAIGKMQDVSSQEGRTVLFVSHNMTAVKNLCRTGIYLENGRIKNSGEITFIVDKYLNEASIKGTQNKQWSFEEAPGTEKIKIKSAYVQHKGDRINVNTPFEIVTEFWNMKEGFELNVSMHLLDVNNVIVFAISTPNVPLSAGLHKAIFFIPANLMNDGLYFINNVFVSDSTSHFNHTTANTFEVFEERGEGSWHGKWPGYIRPTFVKSEIY